MGLINILGLPQMAELTQDMRNESSLPVMNRCSLRWYGRFYETLHTVYGSRLCFIETKRYFCCFSGH